MSSTGYPQATVTIRGVELRNNARCRIMAVINASPESFHAASVAVGRQAVRDAAEQAAEQGADLLDIGAMSTAPYKETAITREEEAARMGEAVAAARAASGLPITADTMHAPAARAALDSGADAINDISGLEEDPELAQLIAMRQVPVILMARESPATTPSPLAPPNYATHRLKSALQRAEQAGIRPECIVLDPGVGFFRNQSVRWFEFDVELLRATERFIAMGYPLLIGASRKSFIGELLKQPSPKERLAGSLGIAAWCAQKGVAVIRTHDVGETRDAVRIVEFIEGRA